MKKRRNIKLKLLTRLGKIVAKCIVVRDGKDLEEKLEELENELQKCDCELRLSALKHEIEALKRSIDHLLTGKPVDPEEPTDPESPVDPNLPETKKVEIVQEAEWRVEGLVKADDLGNFVWDHDEYTQAICSQQWIHFDDGEFSGTLAAQDMNIFDQVRPEDLNLDGSYWSNGYIVIPTTYFGTVYRK